jgi:hypothetical protein
MTRIQYRPNQLLGMSLTILAVFHGGLTCAGDVDAPPKAFPDFGFLPKGYRGKVFKLSQNYPKDLPGQEQIPEFFKRDFEGDWFKSYFQGGWKSYMIELRRYCFEANIEVDWRVENNKTRRWFHIPWQHYGPKGREGIHGMTKEAEVKKYQLARTQTYVGGQTYAVAFYNEFGGYTIGKVWNDPAKGPKYNHIEFPHGTVICKLLFVDVPTEQVPSLVDPVLWQGYICENYASNNRSIRPLALIQMDVMVRDDRTPTGWIFGTFQYNGMLKKQNPWENLIPVGVQWGNDETVRSNTYSIRCPTVTKIVEEIRESRINKDTKELPPTHLGWNGRLNGPVDNPRSSCMSCHGAAEYPVKSEMAPFFEKSPPRAGDDRWMRWFKNYKCTSKGGGPFDEGSCSTDFCLQLVQSIDNYYTWLNERGGIFACEYGREGIPERPEPTRDRPETDSTERNDLGLQPKPLSNIQPIPMSETPAVPNAPSNQP